MVLNPNTNNDNSILEMNLNNKKVIQELFTEEATGGWSWIILEKMIQHLYLSFATIKTAVSSLLDYDILWGDNNKHEFLRAIDTGVNQADDTTRLLMLLVLLKENKITLNQDLHPIQEIIKISYQRAKARYLNINIQLDLQNNGNPIFVDFENIVTGIELFIEFFAELGYTTVEILGKEIENHWIVLIGGNMENSILKMMQKFLETNVSLEKIFEFIPAYCLLKFLIAYKVLTIQDIRVGLSKNDGNQLTKIAIIIKSHSLASWVE